MYAKAERDGFSLSLSLYLLYLLSIPLSVRAHEYAPLLPAPFRLGSGTERVPQPIHGLGGSQAGHLGQPDAARLPLTKALEVVVAPEQRTGSMAENSTAHRPNEPRTESLNTRE